MTQNVVVEYVGCGLAVLLTLLTSTSGGDHSPSDGLQTRLPSKAIKEIMKVVYITQSVFADVYDFHSAGNVGNAY